MLVGPLLGRAVELRDRDHRHLELAREDLEAAADLADLLDPAVAHAVGAHQLEVVDDDQAEAAAVHLAGVQAAGLRAQLEDVDVGRVVDPQRRLARARSQALITFGQSLRATWPLRSLSPDIRAWLATKRCASSVSDISSENSATGLLVLDRDVLGDVRHERALAHRGPGGEHDQVRLLKAAGDRRRGRGSRMACRSIAWPSRESCSSLSISSWRISSIERKSPALSACATSNSLRSASSTSCCGSPRRSVTLIWISWTRPSSRAASPAP